MNRAFITSLLSIGLAQFLKIPIKQLKTGRWDWKAMFEAGGMPSSHSAGVASLATYTGLKCGVRTIQFALAAVYGLIVMYDAQGVRRQAGELSIQINDLAEEIDELQGDAAKLFHEKKKERIRERLGHQPIEVIAGALFGVGCGVIAYLMERRK